MRHNRLPLENSIPSRLRFLAAFLLCAGYAADAQTPAIHIRNFSEVNAHLLRGGQPDLNGLRELAAAHVALVIDLREPSAESEWERRTVEGLGMKYLGIPLPGFSSPNSQEVRRILTVLNPDDAGKVFVHCWRGKDRTGTVVACYRIQHDGWNSKKALAEADSHGMSRVERGMRSFIMRYTPQDLPVAATSLQ